MNRNSLLFAIALLLTFATTAGAQELPSKPHAFDRNFALGVYANGWAGDYKAGGIGFRARWEPFARLGFDLFSEHMLVRNDNGLRHDHPIGFNIYVPINVTKWLRVRPMLGACAVFSFIESDIEGSARADDISFGVHGGAGIELALGSRFSLFVDAQAIVYIKHERSEGGWIGSLRGNLDSSINWQGSAGIQLHI